LVHLFGAENTEYSGAVLKLPAHSRVLVAIQGFVHREAQYHPDDAYFKMQCHFEEQILRSFTYYAGEYDSEAVVRQRNDRIVFFPMYFPVNESLARSLTGGLPRIYDLLFLGRSTKAKGIDDFMKIVRLVSRQKADIKAAIAGHGLDAAYLARLVAENSVQNNVAVLGYLPSEAEVFSLCRQSRVLLAPTYNDCFPSTIRECMTLGTPVVAYATGGIPFANKGGRQSLVLVEQGNVGAMAESAQRVLSDAAFRRALVANGRDFAHREFSLESNVNRVMGSYHFILSKEKQFGF
jgi:glycosyltransferase involved in cell wall biosynthesis